MSPRRRPIEPPADPPAAAHAVGLRYVNEGDPGISRRRADADFVYADAHGRRIREAKTLAWIRSIVIPPAWTEVWISPNPNGHILATGRDARGRKQYRYHPRWREARDATKYDRLIEFAETLPRIRERVDADLGRPGLPREKVLAAVVQLLQLTSIRVGNEEYARLNRSFGLTTLRDRHVRVRGSSVHFRFRGKSGKEHETGIRDRRLATVIQRCQDVPGQVLFQYLDGEGVRQTVGSADVNSYLREISGEDLTAKHFRTWAGTVLAFRALCALEPAASETEAQHNVVAAVREVAGRLGNTPAVCRASYVHPGVLDAYLEGDLGRGLPDPSEAGGEASPGSDPAETAAVLRLLRRRVRQSSGAAASSAA